MRLIRLIPLLLLLASCANNPIDPARGSRSANTSTNQQQAAQSSGGQSASDAEWERVLLGSSPTAEHLPAQCPGATNAEIDAALQSNELWVCYAATREAEAK